MVYVNVVTPHKVKGPPGSNLQPSNQTFCSNRNIWEALIQFESLSATANHDKWTEYSGQLNGNYVTYFLRGELLENANCLVDMYYVFCCSQNFRVTLLLSVKSLVFSVAMSQPDNTCSNFSAVAGKQFAWVILYIHQKLSNTCTQWGWKTNCQLSTVTVNFKSINMLGTKSTYLTTFYIEI